MPTMDWVATGYSTTSYQAFLNKGSAAIKYSDYDKGYAIGTLQFTGSTALNSLDISSYNMKLYFNAKVNSSLSYGSSVQLYNYGDPSGSNWNQTINVSGTSSKTYSSNAFTFNKATSGIGTRADIAIRITPPVLGTITIGSFYLRITYTLNTYTITVNSNDSNAGSVSGGASGKYKGDSLTISANPKPGYRFVQWSEDGNTEATRTVKVSGNATYTAIFEKIIAVTDLQLSANNLNIKLSEKINYVYNYVDNLSDQLFQSGIVKNGNCELSSKYVALKATEENCYISPYQESHLVPQIEYLFKIKPNQDYTYTMTMKSLENAETTMYVFYYDSNYNFLTYHNSNRSSEETQIYNWISPENAAYAGLRFDNHNINTKIYFSNVYVYEGKVYNIYNKIDLIEIISPENADNTAVKWNSSNPSVIYINEDYGEMLIQDFGTTIITCTARDDTNGQISAQCVINILPHYEGPKAYLGTTPVKIYFGNDLITNYHFFLS